jgi:hypothetical protein
MKRNSRELSLRNGQGSQVQFERADRRKVQGDNQDSKARRPAHGQPMLTYDASWSLCILDILLYISRAT